jgi:hypothetical protein
MTTSTYYGDTEDGYIHGLDNGNPGNYLAARATGDFLNTAGWGALPGSGIVVGQDYYAEEESQWYSVLEGFIGFNTADLLESDNIQSVTLSLWLDSDNSTTDFVIRARLDDWMPTLTTGDWVTTYTGTLLATKATTGIGATGEYKNFVSESAFPSSVSKNGNTVIILLSDLTESGVAPTGLEWVQFEAGDYLGTIHDPKLVVNYTSLPSNIRFTNVRVSTV